MSGESQSKKMERALEPALRKFFERYGPFNPFKNYDELAADLSSILGREFVILTKSEHALLIADQTQFRKIRAFIEEWKALKPTPPGVPAKSDAPPKAADKEIPVTTKNDKGDRG